MPYLAAVSTREAIIHEIKIAPEALVQEAYDYLLFLKSRKSLAQGAADMHAAAPGKPDFLARQQAMFGNRVMSDSQAIMDELRAERF